MTNHRTYSTGEAAEAIGRSPAHCKMLARLNGVTVPTQGKRGDWCWTLEHIKEIKRLVEKGVAK